jgi:RNA polymerase sigma-70 factor (ECF subfamily)
MGATAGSWEQDILDRITAGDDSALAATYDQYAPVVYGLAVRLAGVDVAADICQEVFVTLWDHPERVDLRRGSLRAFLVTVARRRCIDHLRRQGRRAANEERAYRAAPVRPPDVGESALAAIAGQRVHTALEALPVDQRVAIQLAYFEGMTFRQVAVATGASEGTAKSRIRLGLKRLGDQLGQDERVEPT